MQLRPLGYPGYPPELKDLPAKRKRRLHLLLNLDLISTSCHGAGTLT